MRLHCCSQLVNETPEETIEYDVMDLRIEPLWVLISRLIPKRVQVQRPGYQKRANERAKTRTPQSREFESLPGYHSLELDNT